MVEIGNTAVKAAWSEGITLGKTFRYQGEKRSEFIISLAEKEKPEVMVIASVSDITPSDEKKYSRVCNKLLILDGAHHLVLENYSLPEYLSYDRAAAIVAARHLFKGKSCTIFDFGTILSIDSIAEDGSYKGGNVSLGCRTRFKAVNRYSKALPLVNTPEDNAFLGTSMDSSIESGIILGIMFEIQGYMDANPADMLVFTGGDANYFAKRTKNSIFVICNLVLMGLALITDDYVEKNIQ